MRSCDISLEYVLLRLGVVFQIFGLESFMVKSRGLEVSSGNPTGGILMLKANRVYGGGGGDDNSSACGM